MPINFSALVLAPCMSTFAPTMEVDPVSSRPGAAKYSARGIFTTAEYDIPTQEGIVSDRKSTIGVRIEEFTSHPTDPGPPPAARDRLVFEGRKYMIDDTADDGQGHLKLEIRLIAPDYPT